MLDVLEDEQRRVVGLHMRLRRAVHVHRDAAALVPLERDVLRARRDRVGVGLGLASRDQRRRQRPQDPIAVVPSDRTGEMRPKTLPSGSWR